METSEKLFSGAPSTSVTRQSSPCKSARFIRINIAISHGLQVFFFMFYVNLFKNQTIKSELISSTSRQLLRLSEQFLLRESWKKSLQNCNIVELSSRMAISEQTDEALRFSVWESCDGSQVWTLNNFCYKQTKLIYFFCVKGQAKALWRLKYSNLLLNTKHLHQLARISCRVQGISSQGLVSKKKLASQSYRLSIQSCW